MATLLNLSVVATSSGPVSPSQQYLIGFGQVVRVRAASAKQSAAYPGALSVVTVQLPQNNSLERFDYIVTQSVATIAAL